MQESCSASSGLFLEDGVFFGLADSLWGGTHKIWVKAPMRPRYTENRWKLWIAKKIVMQLQSIVSDLEETGIKILYQADRGREIRSRIERNGKGIGYFSYDSHEMRAWLPGDRVKDQVWSEQVAGLTSLADLIRSSGAVISDIVSDISSNN